MPDEPSYPVPDDVHLLPLLMDLVHCYQVLAEVLGQDIASYGMTPQEFDVLSVLGDSPGKPCKQVAGEVMISSPTMTRVFARLEARGWLQGQSGADARQKIVSLTPDGQAAYERAFLPHVRMARERLARLTDAEQADLSRLLGKLRAAFEADPRKE